MCGILGGNKTYWNYQSAIESISHRGPDGQKIQKVKDFFLGFTRLAIIDLNNDAMQPMFSSSGNYVIVFNGEIYNYQVIRAILEQRGYQFKTKSDTEVLLYSFAEWKEKMTDNIDGIFAAVIMDVQEEKLYLFRDRPGVKPLYYYYDGSSFAFASELKAIRKMCSNVSFKIDNTAIYDYHTYLYIPEPKTMYKNVYKLEPASYMVFDMRKKKIILNEKYWKVKLNTQEGNIITKKQIDDKAEELRYHLDRVVKRQIVSDVPVGTFLSGGVDSSIITAITKDYIQNVTGYSIGFTAVRYDESKYAKKVANILDVNYRMKRFKLNDYAHLEDMLCDLYDEPFADTSAYPTYFLSKFAKEDVTVVLTGDGGDELFGGYPRCLYAQKMGIGWFPMKKKLMYLYLDYENRLKNNNVNLDDLLKDEATYMLPYYQFSIRPDRLKLRKKYNIDKDYDDAWFIRKYYHKELPTFTRLRYLDFMTYLPGDILTKVDRASMKVSLEARVPFLDKEIIDFAFSLTQRECNPNGELKGLLKYAYKEKIPLKLLNRKKAGFSIPPDYVKGEGSPQEILLRKFWGI